VSSAPVTPEATIVLKDILRERASRGGAVFYSSHLLDVVERLAGRVIILHRGRVVLDDSLEGALARSNDRSLEEVFRALTSGGAAT
jgi:ABC-2 type transport system ATP-binding protein